MEKNFIQIALVVIGVYLVMTNFGGTQAPAPAPANDQTTQADGSCNYAPTFKLSARDKFDSAVTSTLSQGHLYKINGGASQTYAGTAISVNKGDVISVLWGYGNRSTGATAVNLEKDDFTIANCGVNTLPYGQVPKQLTLNSSITIQCKDEQGMVVHSISATNNYTVGTAGTFNANCQLQLDNAKRAFPGGVLVVEMNSTAYDMSFASVTGEATDGVVEVPSPYTVASTVGKAIAVKIKPYEDTTFHTFTVSGKAQDSINPLPSGGYDITLGLWANNCFENTLTSKFDCSVKTNVASTWAGTEVGSTTLTVD
jgi:hypothetical protein